MAVTQDSSAGWQPSPEQIQALLRTNQDYFDAIEAGDPARAYAMLTPDNRLRMPLSRFFEISNRDRDAAGALVQRRTLRIIWTKDPASAPAPGVYAALDINARHARVDRECGFALWYQRPEGGAFKLMRIASDQIDNFTADRIVGEKGQAELDRLWAKLSARCAP